MANENEALQILVQQLDQLLLGKPQNDTLDPSDFSEDLQLLAEKIITLSENLNELLQFSTLLSKGNYQTTPPPRTNPLCSGLKEIHSQLLSLSWNMEQLIHGQMVAKLYFDGPLFENYNQLIDKISRSLSTSESAPEWSDSITSWRYHQIITAINRLSTMVIEVDHSGKILYSNPAAQALLNGLTNLPDEKSSTDSPVLNYLYQIMNDDEAKISAFQELYDQTRNAWYHITTNHFQFADGNDGILYALQDISEWKQKELQLHRCASIDPLTATLTRKAGLNELEMLLNARKDGYLAFIDIDGLKEINDQYGHAEGDWAIRTTAQFLTQGVGSNGKVIRYGGDEFILILPDTDEQGVIERIKYIKSQIEQICKIQVKPYLLSFSVGYISLSADQGLNLDELIAVADQQMYDNKRAHRLTDRHFPG